MSYDITLHRVTPADERIALEILNVHDAFDPDADDGADDLDVQIAAIIREVRYDAVMNERDRRRASDAALG